MSCLDFLSTLLDCALSEAPVFSVCLPSSIHDHSSNPSTVKCHAIFSLRVSVAVLCKGR
jgi:hypothetical protein